MALRSYGILDTPPDERFDLFTKISTWLFSVPIAAINFVDSERTFFKSLAGLVAYEPARTTSLCAHAVGNGNDIMVVPQLLEDCRFADHPLVTKGLRFYAGAVLRSSSGHAVGTLCVGDVKARTFSEAEQDRLRQLAQGVGTVLELHRSGLMLLEAATQDPLTGLCNRRLLMRQLEHVLPAASPDHPSVLLYLDLDRFKSVNDRFGHAGGDAMLCEVAARLTHAIRESDLVARIAGDEFAILLSPGSTVPYAEQVARRVLAAFALPFSIDGVSAPIGGSIGIASCPSHATGAPGLVRCADLALYQAKRAGRGRWTVFQPEFTTNAEPSLAKALSLGLECAAPVA